MPRQNDGTELIRKLTAIDLYRIASGTKGDTTTSGAVAAAAATIPVTAITNFTAADPAFLIGDGGFELITAIGTPATTMPITNQKIEFAQSAGARFVEAVKVPLGKIESGGFSLNLNRSLTPIESAQDDSPIGYEEGVLELSGGMGLLGFNPENLQLVAGVVESITGAGTSADPYQGSLGGNSQTSLSNFAFRVAFLRNDGKTGHFDLLNARINASGGVTIGKGGSKAFQCGVTFTQLIMRYNT